MRNLRYFNMSFFFKAFSDISHISQNGLMKLFYNNKMSSYGKVMDILKANEIKDTLTTPNQNLLIY